MHPQWHVRAIVAAFIIYSDTAVAEEQTLYDRVPRVNNLERASSAVKLASKLNRINNIFSSQVEAKNTFMDVFKSGRKPSQEDEFKIQKAIGSWFLPSAAVIFGYEISKSAVSKIPIYYEKAQDYGFLPRIGPQSIDVFEKYARSEIVAQKLAENAYWKQAEETLAKMQEECGTGEWLNKAGGGCKSEQSDEENSRGWRLVNQLINGAAVASHTECRPMPFSNIESITSDVVESYVNGAGYEIRKISYIDDRNSFSELVLGGNYHLNISIIISGEFIKMIMHHIGSNQNVEEQSIYQKC